MPDHLKQQSVKVTQEMFDLLPALLTAHEVKTITGLDDRELKSAVVAKEIVAWQRTPRKGRKRAYSKYTKVSVGKLVGFRV
jgi:hypothetical protein